jgi:hypothetical protein
MMALWQVFIVKKENVWGYNIILKAVPDRMRRKGCLASLLSG